MARRVHALGAARSEDTRTPHEIAKGRTQNEINQGLAVEEAKKAYEAVRDARRAQKEKNPKKKISSAAMDWLKSVAEAV